MLRHIIDSAVRISDCAIRGNEALFDGGGLISVISNPDDPNIGISIITGSTISYNMAMADGGGLYLSGSDANVTESTISNNNANYSGGILSVDSYPNIISSTISYNSAAEDGGGLYLSGSYANVINCNIIAAQNISLQRPNIKSHDLIFHIRCNL